MKNKNFPALFFLGGGGVREVGGGVATAILMKQTIQKTINDY